MPTTLTFERQKMSVEIWEKLKSHIMKQREKRKQEQEQDAEQERHRREQELKRKRDAITLEDIKDQLGKMENELNDLQNKKSDLFLQLKKVLNEDIVRKKQTESEILAAKHAVLLATQSQNNQQYLINQSMINNSRLQTSNQLTQQQQQQLNQMQSQQQQQQQQQQTITILPKHSPITTAVTSLPAQSNYMNTVMTQSLPIAHQQQQLTNSNKLINNRKRPLDRSSPQSNVPYNGGVLNYKVPMTSYTPSVSRIATTSHQAFFPQNRSLSIPVSQPSIPGGQLNFDAKASQYHLLAASGLSSGLPISESLVAQAEHANLLNSAAQLNPQLSHLQQEIYHQQIMNKMAGLQSSSLMPIQTASLKSQQQGITAGYPVSSLQRTNNPNTSVQNTNANNRFPGRYY